MLKWAYPPLSIKSNFGISKHETGSTNGILKTKVCLSQHILSQKIHMTNRKQSLTSIQNGLIENKVKKHIKSD